MAGEGGREGVAAAASTEIMQLFHARAPVIGCTFAAEAANTGSSSALGRETLRRCLRANFSVTKLKATSDENYPFFPRSPPPHPPPDPANSITPAASSIGIARPDPAAPMPGVLARARDFNIVIDKNFRESSLPCRPLAQQRFPNFIALTFPVAVIAFTVA